MNTIYLLDLSIQKSNLAIGFYIIASIAFIVSLVLIFLIFKKKRKDKSRIFIAKAFFALAFLCISILNLTDGIFTTSLAHNLYKDSIEMGWKDTCGYITDSFSRAKTDVIVINSENYIYQSYALRSNIKVGAKYYIKYYSHSKIIFEISEKF